MQVAKGVTFGARKLLQDQMEVVSEILGWSVMDKLDALQAKIKMINLFQGK